MDERTVLVRHWDPSWKNMPDRNLFTVIEKCLPGQTYSERLVYCRVSARVLDNHYLILRRSHANIGGESSPVAIVDGDHPEIALDTMYEIARGLAIHKANRFGGGLLDLTGRVALPDDAELYSGVVKNAESWSANINHCVLGKS